MQWMRRDLPHVESRLHRYPPDPVQGIIWAPRRSTNIPNFRRSGPRYGRYWPPVLLVNADSDPSFMLGARVTAGPTGVYCWHLGEVETEPKKVALRELRDTLSPAGRLDFFRQYEANYRPGS
jgi:hypothetical protein